MMTHRLWSSALALLWLSMAYGQISPGSLSTAHQQWDGLTKCATCHDFGAGARGFKCLECHTEIQKRVQAGSGFHGKFYKASAGETDCVRCHVEHNGAKFPLVQLDRKAFDHAAQTGFRLEGKHREQSCSNCHTLKNISAASRGEIKLKDPNRSLLGLRRECSNCHTDPHGGQLGQECVRCHTQDAWKPAPGFSHSRTAFPLTGQHQTLACQKCHGGPAPVAEPQVLARFKGLSFRGCQSCHTDPHRGAFQDAKFRGTCETCHNTSGWKNSKPGAGFDHQTTKFPLQGKHAEAACSQCHKDSDFHRPIAHELCANCHEDPHKGQFAKRTAGSDCSACHAQTSFKPPRFNRETHQRSAFPLEAKHANLECSKCHVPEGREAVYITGKLACPQCHADAHGAEFAQAPYMNKCDACHTQAGFRPTTFSVARHAEGRFPLTGKHASVVCTECHKPLTTSTVTAKAGVPDARRQYHFASQVCTACHQDPHQTKLACEGCHATDGWKNPSPFNHANTGFALEGPHKNASCVKCHVAIPSANSATAPQFHNTPKECSGCHADTHGGQFRTASRTEDCSVCHTVTRWNAADFDHDKTPFPLDRAHRNVKCVLCHKEQKEVQGKPVRIYRGTPVECVRCH